MVVVVIVGVLAVIAVPSMVERLRERRSSEAAQRIAALYRGARMRAMGRGAAILVRYTEGSFTVLESVQGTAGGVPSGCESLPQSSCMNGNWETITQRRQVTAFNPLRNHPQQSEGSGLTIEAKDVSGSAAAELDVCYTPLGRSYTRGVPSEALGPMNGVISFDVTRGTGNLTRTVTVLPNGVARLAL
jgi:type IV fimbrial biogenesis protein FimT